MSNAHVDGCWCNECMQIAKLQSARQATKSSRDNIANTGKMIYLLEENRRLSGKLLVAEYDIETKLKQIHQCGAELNETIDAVLELRNAIAIHCREEVDIDFEYDDEAIRYFVAENRDD